MSTTASIEALIKYMEYKKAFSDSLIPNHDESDYKALGSKSESDLSGFKKKDEKEEQKKAKDLQIPEMKRFREKDLELIRVLCEDAVALRKELHALKSKENRKDD